MESQYYERLSTDNCAMLLIDHQVGTMGFGITDIDALNLKNNALWLAEQSKIFKLPVILTTSNPDGANGPLFPELIAALPDAPIIDRFIINAWDEPKFKQAVEQTGRKKLIMAGVTADVCLTFPAISAIAELQKDWSLPTGADTGAAYGKHIPNFGYISAHLKYLSNK